MQTEDSPRAELQPPTTVVLVDDEQLIRGALAQALSSGGLELVAEAANGEDAIETVVDVHPDVVLMDLRLPGISGVEAIEQLGLLAPASRVLVLTRSEENRVVEGDHRRRQRLHPQDRAPRRDHQRCQSHRGWGICPLPAGCRKAFAAHPRARPPRQDER